MEATSIRSPVPNIHRPVRARLRAMIGSLIASEARVATVLLEHPESAITASVGQIAGRAGTSTSTVVRTCQHLGFAGFQDFKLALAQELAAAPPPLGPAGTPHTDPAHAVLAGVLSASTQRVEEVRASLDPSEFGKAVTALATAETLLCVGHSTSAATAQDAAYCLSLVGVRAAAPQDLETQAFAATTLSASDVCLLISHTGATTPLLSIAGHAADTGATVVALTSTRGSPLHRAADIALVAGALGSGFPLEAMASRVAHLIVIDALYIAAAELTRPRATAALDAAAAITAADMISSAVLSRLIAKERG